MKKFIKFFSYAIIMALTATMVSGCSNKKTSSKPTRPFVIWSFEDNDVWVPKIKEIKKKYGVEVQYSKKSAIDAKYENDALNSILSGQGPDLMIIPSEWAYRHKDKLASAPTKLATDINIETNYVPSMKQACQFDNNIYCLSPYSDSLMIYYNPAIFQTTLEQYKDAHQPNSKMSEAEKLNLRQETNRINNILSKPPYLWSDFAEASRLITKKDGQNINLAGVAIGTSNNITESVDLLYALMMQNGTKMTSDDLKLATFSLPGENESGAKTTPGKNALDFLSSFSNPGNANYSWNASMPKDIDAFTQGKAAMIFSYSSLSGYLAQNYPNFKYKTSTLPQIGDSQSNIIDYASFYVYASPKASPYSSIAWDMINAISSAHEFNNTLHSFSSAKKKDFKASLTTRQSDTTSVMPQTANTWSKGRYPIDVDNIFKSTIDKTIAEPSNSQAFLDSAAVEVTNILKKTEW